MPRQDRIQKRKREELNSAARNCRKLSSFFSHTVNETEEDVEVSATHSDPVGITVSAAPSALVSKESGPTGDLDVCEQASISDSVKPNSVKTNNVRVQTVQSWIEKDGFSWVKFNTQDHDEFIVKEVWCSVCREIYSDNKVQPEIHAGQALTCDIDAFVKGTRNIKKDTARCHQKSKYHMTAVQRLKAKTQPTGIVKEIQKMGSAAFDRMIKLFTWAYMIAKQELPFTQFPVIIATAEKTGSDLGSKYRNDKACEEFVKYIGIEMEDQLQQSFQRKPFYCSLLFDGSTDKQLSQKEVISLKVLENGQPKIKLLSLASPPSGSAEDIFNSLIEKAGEKNLQLDQVCVGAGADGASVNFGCKSGVMTRLEDRMPWLMKVHCVAHRLELALKDAFKGTFFSETIDDFMLQLFYLFKRSDKKWKGLQDTASIVEDHILKPSKSQGTRWIGHRVKALKVLDRNYRSLRLLFEDMGSGQRSDITGSQVKISEKELR